MRARIIDRRTEHRAAVALNVGSMALASACSMLGPGLVVGLAFLAASLSPFLIRPGKARPADGVSRK